MAKDIRRTVDRHRKYRIMVAGGLTRIVAPMLLGALVSPCAVYLLGFVDPRPGDLIGFGLARPSNGRLAVQRVAAAGERHIGARGSGPEILAGREHT